MKKLLLTLALLALAGCGEPSRPPQEVPLVTYVCEFADGSMKTFRTNLIRHERSSLVFFYRQVKVNQNNGDYKLHDWYIGIVSNYRACIPQRDFPT